METNQILKLIENRIKDLYSLKDSLCLDPDKNRDELLTVEGKLSELIHLKATIDNLKKM